MLNEVVLIDTGPLIAIYNANDEHHQSCREQSELLPVGKAFTCWPVITEASYMLRHFPNERNDLLVQVENHDLQMVDIEAADVSGVLGILGQYRDQQIDLADACLLHLANREGIDTVFALDRRHFSVFRKTNGNSLNLIP